MRVCELMDRNIILCRLDDSVKDVVKLMKANHLCPIVVVDQTGEVWGLVSRLAVIRLFGKDLSQVTAEDVMRPYRFEVDPQWPVERALSLMKRTGFEHLIVIDPHAGPKRPIGILSSFNVVWYMSHIETGHYESILKMPEGWCPSMP